MTLTVGAKTYVVLLDAMQQTQKHTTFKRRIRRGGASAGSILGGFPGDFQNHPVYWNNLTFRSKDKQPFAWIPVPSQLPLYKEVVAMFKDTAEADYDIVELQLNFDIGRFGTYLAQKQAFDVRHVPRNERWLWHGTAVDTLARIQANGFARALPPIQPSSYPSLCSSFTLRFTCILC